MVKDTKLQVPISNKMKSMLQKRSEKEGFSSVNEYVRVILHKVIQRDLDFDLIDSHKAAIEVLDDETEKRVAESIEAYKRGEYDTIDSNIDPHAIDKYLDEIQSRTV